MKAPNPQNLHHPIEQWISEPKLDEFWVEEKGGVPIHFYTNSTSPDVMCNVGIDSHLRRLLDVLKYVSSTSQKNLPLSISIN